MNKTAILQTSVCKLEDEIYVFESPLLPGCIGAADTKQEAWEHFRHHVETAYTAYLEGCLVGMYDRPGRPARHRTPLTLRVRPETKKRIAKLAEEKECTQGEITDYLLAFWEAEQPDTTRVKNRSPLKGKRQRA
jgi:predicted RNase H-like HicB family nuclease